MKFFQYPGRILAVSAVAVFSTLLLPGHARAAVATFTNLPPDSPTQQFTDAASGITFSNPHSLDADSFYLCQSNYNPAFPNITPGEILSGDSSTIPSALDMDFGFTMTFASPVSALTMDMAYASNPAVGPAAITLTGYDQSGAVDCTLTQNFGTTGLYEYDNLGLSFPDGMSSVTVTATNLAEGFANICIQPAAPIPEPASLAILMVGISLLPRRRR